MNGAHVHTLSRHEFVSFTFHFHCLERAGIGNDKNNDWLSAIKVRQVNLTGQSLNYGTMKWQHITWMRTEEETLAGSPDHWMKKCEKSTPSDSTGSINPVLLRFAWWDFFSIISAPSASRKIQLTWAPSFMWWSYSCCHKSGRKSSLALSQGLAVVRSRTNHGVKHNSEVVVKLFTFPLSISVIYGGTSDGIGRPCDA